MNHIINMFLEMYKLLFIGSMLYTLYVVFNLGFKIIMRFYILDENVVFKLTNTEKIMLWVSLSLLLTYLI